MAIIALKAWYLEQYRPIRETIERPHDLRLSRNSLLKSGLRADFLDDSKDVEASVWFKRYLEGETIEFYIEGSGGYAISNIDLISQEIYFTKQEVAIWQEPIIFFSYQKEYPKASEILRECLSESIEILNRKSRFPLTLEASARPLEGPLRLGKNQLNKIRKSLVFVADGTPVVAVAGENKTSFLLPSPNVCVEIGYALQSKRSGNILLASMERPDVAGNYPFDFPVHQQLGFKTAAELKKTLPGILKTLLGQFNLFAR